MTITHYRCGKVIRQIGEVNDGKLERYDEPFDTVIPSVNRAKRAVREAGFGDSKSEVFGRLRVVDRLPK